MASSWGLIYFCFATMGYTFNWVLCLMCIAMSLGSDSVLLNFDILLNFLCFQWIFHCLKRDFFRPLWQMPNIVVQKIFGGCSKPYYGPYHSWMLVLISWAIRESAKFLFLWVNAASDFFYFGANFHYLVMKKFQCIHTKDFSGKLCQSHRLQGNSFWNRYS
jgi:hypothetical protein